MKSHDDMDIDQSQFLYTDDGVNARVVVKMIVEMSKTLGSLVEISKQTTNTLDVLVKAETERKLDKQELLNNINRIDARVDERKKEHEKEIVDRESAFQYAKKEAKEAKEMIEKVKIDVLLLRGTLSESCSMAEKSTGEMIEKAIGKAEERVKTNVNILRWVGAISLGAVLALVLVMWNDQKAMVKESLDLIRSHIQDRTLHP